MAESAISQFNMIGADEHLQSGQPRSGARTVSCARRSDRRGADGNAFQTAEHPTVGPERIVESRNDHLAWMHEHFAYETLVAGVESEVDKGPGEPAPQPQATLATAARHPHPYFPGKP